jgi:hypothetical protein
MPTRRPRHRLTTKNGRDFYVVASLLQKSLRRGDIVLASRAANELLPTHANYCWNRLLIVSAEDCGDMVTGEVIALHAAWLKVTGGKTHPTKPLFGHVFVMKAIILLARCRHSRDADELLLLVADRLPDNELDAALAECDAAFVSDADWEIPVWAYDVHTARGKRAGKTRSDFLRDEHDALTNSTAVFGNFDEMAASGTYVEPTLPLWPEVQRPRRRLDHEWDD